MDPNKNRKEEGLEIRGRPLSNPRKKSSELKKKPRKAETNPSQKNNKTRRKKARKIEVLKVQNLSSRLKNQVKKQDKNRGKNRIFYSMLKAV